VKSTSGAQTPMKYDEMVSSYTETIQVACSSTYLDKPVRYLETARHCQRLR
jgi:hypothetical protein